MRGQEGMQFSTKERGQGCGHILQLDGLADGWVHPDSSRLWNMLELPTMRVRMPKSLKLGNTVMLWGQWSRM